jgi:hypothetical protein
VVKIFLKPHSITPNGGFWELSSFGSSLLDLSLRIDDPKLTQVQFAHTSFDFGAVSDYHPSQVVRTYHLFSSRVHIAGFQSANFSRVSVVVIVGKPELHQIDDRLSQRGQGLARSRKAQGFIGLNLCELVFADEMVSDNSTKLFVDLDQRLFCLVSLHRP